MSSYATLTDLYALAIPSGAIAKVSTANQQLALDAASDHVDSYLGARFVLPLVTYGNDIKRAVCFLAAYDILCGRGFNPQNENEKNIRDRAEKAEEWLKGIADEKVTPAGIVDSSPNAGTSDQGLPWTGQVQTVSTVGNELSLLGDPSSTIDCNVTLQVGAPRLRGW